MRSILLFACLCLLGSLHGQGSGFSFSYNGPTQINVGQSCMAPLNWGHPNTPTAHSNLPGGMIVYFDIYSISGGFQYNDLVPGGTTVTIFYQAIDNFGNSALFGFSIVFIDIIPPVFDPLSLPQNITLSCSNNLPPPANVEASDNCADEDPPLTITYTQTGNVSPCAGGTIQRKWVADDDLGNQATFIQTITVVADVTPPVITNNLVNGMAPCSTAMAQYTTWLNTQRANFTATDAGCGVMSKTDNAPPPSQITSFCGVIEVTFTATDNCNNTSTLVRTFTVTNNVPPVITTPANGASGECSSANITQQFNTWINTHGGATATDDCSSIFWSTFPPSPSIADTCNASVNVMFIASDGCNNFDTTSASFILIDNTPPTITTQPTTVVISCNSTTLDSLLLDWLTTGGHSAASDFCTPANQLQLGYRMNDVEMSLQDVLDAWQDSLVAGCRDGVIINGLGINNVKAVIEVEFTYDDKCDNEGSATAFFGITDNGRPVFDTLPSNSSYVCSDTVSWNVAFQNWYESAGNADFSDLCSDVTVSANMTLDSALAVLEAAMDTACSQGASVTVQFTLVDECGNTSLTSPSASFSLQDTLPPGFTNFASDLLADCAQNSQQQLQNWLDTVGGATAVDGCGDLSWTFHWTDTAGVSQNGIPLTGPYPQVGALGCNESIDIIFIVEDVCQNTAADTATFMVLDTTGPTFNIANDTIHLACTDTIPEIDPGVGDLCDPNPVVTFTDSIGVNTCLGHSDFVRRTWIATDACGNSSSAQVWILSADTIPPTFDLPPDTVSFCSVDTLLLLNVADNCDPDPLVTFSDEITGQTCHEILQRTWVVTDDCGNSATAVQQFDLSDETSPVIEYSPGDFVFSCDTSFGSIQEAYEHWQDSVVISDGCSESGYFIALPGSYVLSDTTTWPGQPLPDSALFMCGQSMTIVGDLVAFDECGNAVVEEISFSVNDTVSPYFITCPGTVAFTPDTSCTARVILDSPDFVETCFPNDVRFVYILDGGDSILINQNFILDTVLGVGFHTISWIAIDCNENAGTCTTTIGIIDEEAISLTCQPDTFVYVSEDNCTQSLFIHAPVTTVGECGRGPEFWRGYVVGNADPDTFNFANGSDSILISFFAGLQNVYLIVADSTGDIDTCLILADIRDTFPPDVICQNDTLFIPPSGLDTIDVSTSGLVLSTNDNCGIDTIVYDPPRVGCSSNGLDILVTITVTDAGGNTSTCTANLFVATQPLNPSWERGLCDDTLRLFANLPNDSLANYSYNWSGPNGFVSSEENPVLPGSDSGYSGTYTLIVQSGNGCTSTGSVEVEIADLVSPIITANEDTLCIGDSITLTSQVFSGNITYQWYETGAFGGTLIGETAEPMISFDILTGGVHTYYAIVVSDTCSSDPGPEINVFVAPVPVAEVADLPTILCITDSLFLAPLIVEDSLDYKWFGPGGYVSGEATPPGIPATIIDSFGIFELVVSTAYCNSIPDSITVMVQQPPAAPQITGDAQGCEEGTITLHASNVGDSFIWIDPQNNIIPTPDSTLVISNIDQGDAGNYFVITSVNGCPSDTSEAFNVTVDTTLSIEIVTTERVCFGDVITLTVEPFVSGTFAWTGPPGFISDETAPNISPDAGTYFVHVVTSTGCEASDSVNITVDFPPVILSGFTSFGSCIDTTEEFSVSVVTNPPFDPEWQFNWAAPGNFTVQDSSIVYQAGTLPSTDTLYCLIITNGVCTSPGEFCVGIFDYTILPTAPVISGAIEYCSGDSIQLFIDSPLPGGVYTWTSADTTIEVPSPGTLVIPNATVDESGLYQVSVKVDSCVSASTNFVVQVKPALPNAVISGTSFVCEGDSLILHANVPNGAIIQWAGPNGFVSNEETIIIYPATTDDAGGYVLGYQLDGCDSPIPDPFFVEVQSKLVTPLINADITSLCIDAPIPVNVCLEPTSLIPNSTYTWILNGTTVIGTPSSDSCILFEGAPLQVGNNLVTVMATLQGCVSDTSNVITIIGDAIPELEANAGSADAICPGDPIILNGNNPSPGTGVWTTPDPLVIFEDETNPNTGILPLPSGEYTFYWTLSYETCLNYSTDSVTLTLITTPLAFPDTVEVPFGQTEEFAVLLNDSLLNPYTIQIGTAPQKGNAVHAGNGIFRYSPNLGFVGTDMMTYILCSVDCPEECSEGTVVLLVGNESDCFVPTLFTPNGDGINDVLIVPCLETSRYPNNKIIIFNEWGDAVYTSSPYQNNWDGTLSGNDLPVGTYFYIMDFGDGSTPKKSFLVLER